MSFLKKLFGSSTSETEIAKKGREGIIHYQNKDHKRAVVAFEEYFQLKGYGKFPDLDKDDQVMLINLGNAKQYSADYLGAIKTYDNIIQKIPNWNAPYLMKAVCFYKLGDTTNAKTQWEIAKKLGNEIAQNPFETTIIKFK